jgi:hypothetical protein
VERLIKNKSWIIIVGLIFLYLVMLCYPKQEALSDYEKTKIWKLRDFYLVYKMWTDEEYRNVNGK